MATIKGDNASNLLYGGFGNDKIYGLGGNDKFYTVSPDYTYAYGGADILDGGVGDDTFVINSTFCTSTFIGGSGFDKISIEYKSTIHRLVITESSSIETLYMAPADIWTDQEEVNLIGTDYADYINITGIKYFSGGHSFFLNGGDDRFFGSNLPETIYGDDGSDIINGGGGDDYIVGGSGNNILYGGAGDDTFVIGQYGTKTGRNKFFGGSGIDTLSIDFFSDTNYLVIDKKSSIELIDNVFDITGTSGNDFFDVSGVSEYTNDAYFILSNGDDKFIGSDQSEIISGGSGNDIIYGNGGSDKIYCGLGNDIIYGGSGNDIFYSSADIGTNTYKTQYYGGSGVDEFSIYGTSSYKYLKLDEAASIEVMTLDIFGNINGTGANDVIILSGVQRYSQAASFYLEDGNDIFTGSAVSETVYGGTGNDTLRGGGGSDSLFGGTGSDVFTYTQVTDSTSSATDTINDFSASEGDKIKLNAIDANTSTAKNDAFVFIGATAFSGQAGQLRFAGGMLQGDVNGDRVADISIALDGTTSLANSDLIL